MSPMLYSIIGFVVWLIASRIQQRRLERGDSVPHGSAPRVQNGLAALGCLAPFCTDPATRAAWQVLCSSVLLPVQETSPNDGKG